MAVRQLCRVAVRAFCGAWFVICFHSAIHLNKLPPRSERQLALKGEFAANSRHVSSGMSEEQWAADESASWQVNVQAGRRRTVSVSRCVPRRAGGSNAGWPSSTFNRSSPSQKGQQRGYEAGKESKGDPNGIRCWPSCFAFKQVFKTA